MKFLKKVILVTILLFIFFPAIADDNIAYLDMNIIMFKSLAGQSIQKQLETKHKKNIENFKKSEKSFKDKEEKILTKKNVLSKEDYEKEILKLRTEVKDFRITRKEAIDSLTKKRLESIQKLLKSISPILGEYSKEKNISIIFDKKYIIVGKTDLNITNEILELLDNKVKKISLD
jgi:outer membrane protein